MRDNIGTTTPDEPKDAPDRRTAAYSIAEFCKQFGVGRTFVYSEISSGRLKIKKAGRRTLIPVEEAARWFAALPSGGPRR
jgi:excisionase family DNA binding protein